MAKARKDPRYKLQISKKASKGLDSLPQAKQNAVKRILLEYLEVNPLEHFPGKTKELHGRYKGILQYDVDDKYRIHYTVDRQTMTVYVDFIGPHPQWQLHSIGWLYPAEHERPSKRKRDMFEANYYPIQVKQKDRVGRPDIDSFETAMRRDRRTRGYFVGFGFSADATKEIRRVAREEGLDIRPITVKQLLDYERVVG